MTPRPSIVVNGVKCKYIYIYKHICVHMYIISLPLGYIMDYGCMGVFARWPPVVTKSIEEWWAFRLKSASLPIVQKIPKDKDLKREILLGSSCTGCCSEAAALRDAKLNA